MHKIVTGVLVVIALLIGYAVFSGSVSFGGANATGPAHEQLETFKQGLQISQRGTMIAGVVTGSCNIWAPANTIAATSSQQVECQRSTTGTISRITGITADSICTLQTASSTSVLSGGLIVGGVSASSSVVNQQGSIVARLVNLTGTTFTWSATASSSPKWNYTCIDPS